MKKEQLSTSTQEEPKVKLALQEKYNEEDKKENQKQENLINQTLDLAKLSQNLLKGEDLNKFINRSLNMIK